MSKPSNKQNQVYGDGPEKSVKCRRVEVTAGLEIQICDYKYDHPAAFMEQNNTSSQSPIDWPSLTH